MRSLEQSGILKKIYFPAWRQARFVSILLASSQVHLLDKIETQRLQVFSHQLFAEVANRRYLPHAWLGEIAGPHGVEVTYVEHLEYREH
jgi:hypothetical protein